MAYYYKCKTCGQQHWSGTYCNDFLVLIKHPLGDFKPKMTREEMIDATLVRLGVKK